MSSAWRWLSSLRPAQASATTRTSTPASAAATAVDSTQQSVDTPARTSWPGSPPPGRPPLVERRGVQRRAGLAGELVRELIDPRVRRLQRERPLVVVLPPCPLRDLRRD